MGEDEQREREVRPEGWVDGPNGRWMRVVDPELVMFTYDRMPTMAQDEQLVAKPPTFVLGGTDRVSRFDAENAAKFTGYVVTNIDGDDARHWALEDTVRYADGEYLLTIHAWNIRRSTGQAGAAPDLGDATLAIGVRVETSGQERRLRLINP